MEGRGQGRIEKLPWIEFEPPVGRFTVWHMYWCISINCNDKRRLIFPLKGLMQSYFFSSVAWHALRRVVKILCQ